MKEILIAIVVGVVSSIIIELLKILFFKKPFEMHKELYAKIKFLERNYIDIFNKNLHDNFYLGIMEKQLKLIKQLEDELYKVRDMYPIFAFIFNYEKIIFQIKFLLHYTKDPIMLKKDRLFSKDYEIDLKRFFKKLSFYMNFQYKILLLLIPLLLIIYLYLK